MASGNVGAKVLGLMLLALTLAAAKQPGGIGTWLRAKVLNRA